MTTEKMCTACIHYSACLLNSKSMPAPCAMYEDKGDYCKRESAEWVAQDSSRTRFACSKCKSGNHRGLEKYCHACGRRMKDGAE